MIRIVQGHQDEFKRHELEQVWRLRHEIFVEEKGWNALRKPDGREIDQFDDEHAVHMLAWKDRELVGYQRMLPTVRPHLLTDVYPQLCEFDPPRSSAAWEWTRYAVRRDFRSRGRMLSPVANYLLSAIVEWGLEKNINSIVVEMNPLWMLRLVQLQFRVVPLGNCQKLDGEEVLAVLAHFDRRALLKLQEVRGNSQLVLTGENRLAL